MAKLALYWPVDVSGYHIEAPPHVGPSIVRNGGRLMTDRDVLQCPALYQRLADCEPTGEGALKFVSKYGFLSGTRIETVEFICQQIAIVRSLLNAKNDDDRKALDDWMANSGQAIRLHAKLQGEKTPQLFFAPRTLIDAVYLQFFQDLSTSPNLRLCARPGCDEWFTFGPGTEHRNTAQYCSPKCQKAHTYEKTKGSKS